MKSLAQRTSERNAKDARLATKDQARSLATRLTGGRVLSAEEIVAALRQRQVPNLDKVQRARWVAAINALLLNNELEAAEFGARHFYKAHPDISYARGICQMFDLLPPAGDEPQFLDDVPKEVQVLGRDGAESALLIFCGGGGQLGGPVPLLHRWIRRLPAHLIYLRDFRHLFYLAGLPTLGADRRVALAALQEIASSLGAKRILCCGNSAGAFGALHYGVDLGAEAVLSLAGPTTLDLGSNLNLLYRSSVERLHKQLPGVETDLAEIYRAVSAPPRALLVYGDNNWDDRLHAERMAGVPNVSLYPLAGAKSHHVAVEAVRLGLFEALLDWLVQA